MNDRLKRCPFCGDYAVKKEYFRAIGTLFIRCLGCESYFTVINDSGFLADDKNGNLLESKWNRRAEY